MRLKPRKPYIFKGVVLWIAAAVLLIVMAAPALSTIFAAPGSVNTKALVKNAVTSAKIKNGTIKNADIAAGAAIAESKIARPPRTGYLSLTGPDFTLHTGELVRDGAGGDVYGTGTGIVWVYTTVHLPHGATITGFRFVGLDNDATWDSAAKLERHDETGSAGIMAWVVSSGQSGSNQNLIDNSIDTPVIDNINYTYLMYIQLHGEAGANLKASKVVITYTYSP